MMELKPCPCGRNDPGLSVSETSDGTAYITCSQCHSWTVRTRYIEEWSRDLRNIQYSMAWNASPRGKEE